MMCDVRLTSGAWLVVAALLLAGGVTGCAEDTAGPLRLQGNGGMVVDPVDTGVWFRTSGCLAKGSNPLDVMVTGVTTSPRNGHVATLATWNDGSPVVLAKPGRPPAAYEPVTATSHTGGTLAGCLARHRRRPVARLSTGRCPNGNRALRGRRRGALGTNRS